MTIVAQFNNNSFDFEAPQRKNVTKKNGKKKSAPCKGRILIMDDEKMIRDISREILIYLGYEVELAEDGAEAITLYKKAEESGENFDIVIMDLTIPGGMGAREAIKKLKDIAPDAKVLVSTGYSHDPIVDNFKEYGFCGVIIKPFKANDLNDTLKKVLVSCQP